MMQHQAGQPRRRMATAALILLAAVATARAEDPPAGFQQAYERGENALRSRDYDAAESAFRSAVAAAPENTDALLKLGMTLSRKRDFSGAESAYRTLLTLDPRHVQAMNNLANVYFRQDRYEEAGEYYGRALEIEPDYLLALFHNAWILRHLNHPEEAAVAFRHCLEVQPKSHRERFTQTDCRFYLGTLQFRQREFDSTVTLMEQVLSERPGQIEAHYYLGMAYRHLGRMDEARERLAIHRQLLDIKRRDTPIEKATDAEKPTPIEDPDN